MSIKHLVVLYRRSLSNNVWGSWSEIPTSQDVAISIISALLDEGLKADTL
ncbi:hypothetical protein ACQKCU_24840 [Heyndrickxia sporothermodurans]